jgi:hypothetical protein
MIFKMHCAQEKGETLTAHTESRATDCETTNFNKAPGTKLFETSNLIAGQAFAF